MKVKIKEFRGIPSTGGYFYSEDEEKLKPGEVVDIAKKDLPKNWNEFLEIVPDGVELEEPSKLPEGEVPMPSLEKATAKNAHKRVKSNTDEAADEKSAA